MTEQAEMKPWQLGYPLDELKRDTILFKVAIKPLCNGAFGCPNEQAVAAAKAAGQFYQQREEAEAEYAQKAVEGEGWGRKEAQGEELLPAQAGDAAAIIKTLKAGSQRQDFAGRLFSTRAGDRIIEALAWEPGNRGGVWAAKAILAEEMAKINKQGGQGLVDAGPVLWVKTHQDRTELVNMLKAHGFELVSVQISAGSDVIGLWATGPGKQRAKETAPKISMAEARGLGLLNGGKPYLSPATIEAILSEIKAADHFFAQHYSNYNKKNSWTAFAMRGYDAEDPMFIIKPAEMSKKWKAENPERLEAKPQWTCLRELMPVTAGVVSQLPGGFRDRVRIMRLAPGGELTRHADITDRDAGVADGKLCRIHIPLKTSAGCIFRGWDLLGQERQGHMPAGHMCYLDQRKPHACKNDSPEERLHLVVDVECGPELRDMVANAGSLLSPEEASDAYSS